MHTKYTNVDDKVVVIDEDNTMTIYDKTESISEILDLENELEVLCVKEDYLTYELEKIENEYKEHNFGAYKTSKFLSKLNIIMLALLVFTGVYSKTLSVIGFLIPMEVVMGLSIDHFNKMAKKQYRREHKSLKEDIEENYKEIEKLEDRLTCLKNKTKSREVDSKDTNINYLKNIRNSYMNTYGLSNNKIKKL